MCTVHGAVHGFCSSSSWISRSVVVLHVSDGVFSENRATSHHGVVFIHYNLIEKDCVFCKLIEEAFYASYCSLLLVPSCTTSGCFPALFHYDNLLT